jgi:hypothetical protein
MAGAANAGAGMTDDAPFMRHPPTGELLPLELDSPHSGEC